MLKSSYVSIFCLALFGACADDTSPFQNAAGSSDDVTVDSVVDQPSQQASRGALEFVSFTLSSTQVNAGETLSGTVTLKNTGTTSQRVAQVLITARPPGATNDGGPFYDLQPRLPATELAPGQSVELTATLGFGAQSAAGYWHAFPSYEDADGAMHDGASATFSVLASGDPAPTTPTQPTQPTQPPTPTTPPAPSKLPMLTGVNLSGADWGEGNLPGTYNGNYTWPTTAEVDHFTKIGMNVFRLPFRWERLQKQQYAAFDSAELGRLTSFVKYATDKGAYVLIDPHNYARYFGKVIGDGVPVAAFQDFWTKLATLFKDNPRVIFGVMNEPMDMSTELWLADANAAIQAIRATGAKQLVLVPGNAWTGAHSWLDNWYGTANGTVMTGVKDPGNNWAIEVHQYLDPTSGGTNMNNCVSRTIGSERLVKFTNWAKQHKIKAFLGEFGAGPNANCLAAIDDMLNYVDKNTDVYLGWTWWAAGPWWSESTEYSIEPSGGRDKPQTAELLKHIRR